MKPYFLSLIALLTLALGTMAWTPQPVQAHEHHAEHPLLVKIQADWCPACKNIAPAWSALEKQYKGQVQFVTLDVTDNKTAQQAAKTAKSLGLSKWFEQNRTKTSLVALIHPESKMIIKTFVNEANAKAYQPAIDDLIQRL